MLVEIFLGVTVFILVLFLLDRRPKGLPPGEWGWPIIGYIPPTNVPLTDVAKRFHKKYGDIFTWRAGSSITIYLNNYQLIKTAFAKPELQDRPNMFTFDAFTEMKKTGIGNANGILWQYNRRFALRHLKEMGFGKSSLEDIILYEAECLVNDFKNHAGKETEVPWSLNVAILNVIWKLTADMHYDVTDKKIQEFEKMINSLLYDIQGPMMFFDIFPWAVDITPTFVKHWMGVGTFMKKVNELKDYIMKVINEHKATLNRDSPRDYIDNYLIEMEDQKDNPEVTMDLDNLWACVADLFFAGSETTSSTIRWIVLYLIKYPEVQARMQAEIDASVPSDRLPSLQDKPKLPYTEAVIQEVMRLQTTAPTGIPHFSSEDTELAGYKIPKGTVILANAEVCHKDPTYWEYPEEFYPEHFLDKEGKFDGKKEGFLPFSLGRRICIGESLAKMELLLFVSALLQNFSFAAPEGVAVSTERNPATPVFNIPRTFKIIINNRK